MYDDYENDYFPRYVSVAERKAEAAKLIAKLKKKGKKLSPVHVKSKIKIAQSFWGSAWCRNIEIYRDLAYRVERGRSYLRSGSVIDLKISGRTVRAQVSGSSLYKVTITFSKLPKSTWNVFTKKCAGEIDSIIDLFNGKLPKKVLNLIADKKNGLFPKPSEIHFDCNCPDYADVCKHISAVLYGIAVRFDNDPKLFFELRGVDPTSLITDASKELANVDTAVSDAEGLENLFGIELDRSSLQKKAPVKKVAKKKVLRKSSSKLKKKSVGTAKKKVSKKKITKVVKKSKKVKKMQKKSSST